MRIGVFIKQVPAEGTVNTGRDHTLNRNGVAKIINPTDVTALEEALRIKDQTGAHITVCTMGPPSAESALRQTAAMGADHLCLISDRALAGSDTFITAKVLSKAVQHLGGFDLILCGRRSIDGETGQVGPELAALLNVPCIANCVHLQVKDQAVVCRRMLESETQVWRVPLPALVTIHFGINAPRLPSIMGLRRANGTAVELLTAAALGIPPQECGLLGSPTRVSRVTTRPLGKRTAVRMIGPEGVAPTLAIIQEALQVTSNNV